MPMKSGHSAAWKSISDHTSNVILSFLLLYNLIRPIGEVSWAVTATGFLIRLPYFILVWRSRWLRGSRIRVTAVIVLWLLTLLYGYGLDDRGVTVELIFYLIGFLALSVPVNRSALLAAVMIGTDVVIFFGESMLPDQILIFTVAHAGTYILFWGARLRRESVEVSKRHYEELRGVHAELKQAHEALQHTHLELEDATVRLLHYAVLEERNRISMDLHDSIGNGLSSVIVQLQALPYMMKKDTNEADQAMTTILKVVRDCLQEVREVAHRMGSDEAGLGVVALSSLVNRVREMSGFAIRFDTPMLAGNWNADMSDLLYRILQEALTNVIRHARASQVVVELAENEGQLTMIIEDNGVYKAEAAISPGFGLASMRARCERAHGSLQMEAAQPQGLRLIVTIPLQASEVRSEGETP